MPNSPLKECSFCHRKVYKLAAPSRGLCANCYYREKRNGSPEYQDRARKPCSVEGCERQAVSNTFCDMHYRRWKRDGDPLSERAEKWGHTASHPLRYTFEHACRTGIAPEWKKDYWGFVKAVGDRPTADHRLYRKDLSKPFEPGNVEWRARSIPMPAATKAERAAYARMHRALYREVYKDGELRKRFGIGLDDYARLHAEQGGLCAICKGREYATDQRTGEPFPLAVDHCRKTEKVRGLLCSLCNRGLGLFQESIERLKSAIVYLQV